MNIKVLKTFELADKDWIQIEAGFNQSFDRNTTKESLINRYKSNVLNYSFHAVCYKHDKVIGFMSIIPFQYLYKEMEFKAGLGCSAFVLKEYRSDVFIYKDMFKALKEECLKNGYSVFLGVPNKNAHKYSIVFLGSKDVGYLPYYALPVRLFTIIKKRKFNSFDPIIAFFISLFCYANKLCSYVLNFKEKLSEYRLLLTDEFHKTRFSSPYYFFSEKKKIKFWYRIVNEDGLKAAYIMDFKENDHRTNKALCAAVWHILRKEKIDIVLYVGTLRLKQSLLLKVPAKYVPKPLPLTYNLLNIENKQQFDSMSDLNLWDFGLMNFDGR